MKKLLMALCLCFIYISAYADLSIPVRVHFYGEYANGSSIDVFDNTGDVAELMAISGYSEAYLWENNFLNIGGSSSSPGYMMTTQTLTKAGDYVDFQAYPGDSMNPNDLAKFGAYITLDGQAPGKLSVLNGIEFQNDEANATDRVFVRSGVGHSVKYVNYSSETWKLQISADETYVELYKNGVLVHLWAPEFTPAVVETCYEFQKKVSVVSIEQDEEVEQMWDDALQEFQETFSYPGTYTVFVQDEDGVASQVVSSSAPATAPDAATSGLPMNDLAFAPICMLEDGSCAEFMFKEDFTTEAKVFAGTTIESGNLCGECAGGVENTGIGFAMPQQAVQAADGTIYIADRSNSRIRKYDPVTATIVTLVGDGTNGDVDGPASSSKISGPHDLLLMPNGDFYFTDRYNHKVKMYVAATQTVTTIAGTVEGYGNGGFLTTGKFNDPIGLVMDSNGDIFVSDFDNNRIRKLDMSTGTISSFLGTGGSGWSENTGIAATIYRPAGMAIDANDNIYFAAHYANRIGKVSPTGVLTRVAGSGSFGSTTSGDALAASIGRPWGVAVHPNGDVYYGDNRFDFVNRVSGGQLYQVSGIPGQAGFDNGPVGTSKVHEPWNMSIAPDGDLIFCTSNTIRKVSNDVTTNLINSSQSAIFSNGNPVGTAVSCPNVTISDSFTFVGGKAMNLNLVVSLVDSDNLIGVKVKDESGTVLVDSSASNGNNDFAISGELSTVIVELTFDNIDAANTACVDSYEVKFN